jgi:hypothetical protein
VEPVDAIGSTTKSRSYQVQESNPNSFRQHHALQDMTHRVDSEMTKWQTSIYHYLNFETQSTTASPQRVAGKENASIYLTRGLFQQSN